MTLVVMVEEPSMEAALNQLLPKIGVDPEKVTIIAHQGVGDLEASIPRKLRAYRAPNVRFLILRDNDRADCKERKARLLRLVADAGKARETRVGIVCQELEAWFIGDVEALELVGYLKRDSRPASLRGNPDEIDRPADVLRRLYPQYQKTSGALAISARMVPDRNRSASFLHIMKVIRALTADCEIALREMLVAGGVPEQAGEGGEGPPA